MTAQSQPTLANPVRKVMQLIDGNINMRSITVAIREFCIHHQQIPLKDALLHFFLNSERKLKNSSDSQWQRVVRQQLETVQVISYIQNFILKKLQMRFITNLKKQCEVQSAVQSDFYLLDDLQISQDIKIKTRFFFKWCKFIQQRREVRRLKELDIENNRKAQFFSQFSIKGTCFEAWKQIAMKIQANRFRSDQIQRMLHHRLKKNCIAGIQQQLQIVSIQQKLVVAVLEKINSLRIKETLQKLKNNKQECSKVVKNHRPSNNIWVHRFRNIISKNGQPLENVSMTRLRQIYKKQYGQLCLYYAWKALKTQHQQTKLKQQKIIKKLVKSNFNNFCKTTKQELKMKIEKRKTRVLVKKIGFLQLVQGINLQKGVQISKQQKFRRIESYQFTKNIIFFLSSLQKFKKQSQNQRIQEQSIFNMQLNTYKTKLINSLKSKLTTRINLKANKLKAQSYTVLSIFKRKINEFKQLQEAHTDLRKQIYVFNTNILKSRVLKGLKMAKNLNKNEYETLSATFGLLQFKMKQYAFRKIQNQACILGNIQFFLKTTQNMIVKLSFAKIVDQLLRSKLKLKKFNAKKDLQRKQFLFGLLLQNAQYSQQKQKEVKNVRFHYAKKRFLKELKVSRNSNRASFELDKKLNRLKKQNFLWQMCSEWSQQQSFQDQVEVCLQLRKKVAFKGYLNSYHDYFNQKQEEQRKISRIGKILIKFSLQRMRQVNLDRKHAIERSQVRQIQLQETVDKVQKDILRRSLLDILKLSPKTLIQKTNNLVIRQNKQFFQLLRTNYCQKMLAAAQKTYLIQQTYAGLQQNAEMQAKLRKLQILRKKRKCINALVDMAQNCIADQQLREQKTEETKQMLTHLRMTSACNFLVKELTNSIQFKQNTQGLINMFKKNRINELMTASMQQQSKKLKQMLAVRQYARNLRRKGFKALKRVADQLVLQENRIRSNQVSKIRMKKSIEQSRKKSKLLETIQRYNNSKVTRVCR